MQIGDEAPTFSLPGTDGREYGPEGVTVVVFTCNHCPYALAWHQRLTRVARDYEGRASFLAVNPNNAETHPADSFDAVLGGRERARPETEPVGCSVKWKR